MAGKQPDEPERAFTTVTLPRPLVARLDRVRDHLLERGGAALPKGLAARFAASLRATDGRHKGIVGLAVVIDLATTLLERALGLDAKG